MISPAEIQQILNNDSYSNSSIKLRCNFLRRFHRFTLDSTEIRCKKTSSISASFWRRDCGGGLLVKRPVEQLPTVHAGEQSNVSLRQLCSSCPSPTRRCSQAGAKIEEQAATVTAHHEGRSCLRHRGSVLIRPRASEIRDAADWIRRLMSKPG
jgi:hypothetical protein